MRTVDSVNVSIHLTAEHQDEDTTRRACAAIQRAVLYEHNIAITQAYIESCLIWQRHGPRYLQYWDIIFDRNLALPGTNPVLYYEEVTQMQDGLRLIKIDGLSVGWANVHNSKINEVQIHTNHVNQTNGVHFKTTDHHPSLMPPPTEPGFYKYSGGSQTMLFLLRCHTSGEGRWYTVFDNGTMEECEWGYIEQALGVWKLVKI